MESAYRYAHTTRLYSSRVLERLRRISLYRSNIGQPPQWHDLDVSDSWGFRETDSFTNLMGSISSGFDHQSWLDMTDYFIKWYKTGSPPAITQDKVYYNYRPHSATAVAGMYGPLSRDLNTPNWLRRLINWSTATVSDPFGPPTNASATRDAVYAAVFLTPDSPAKQLKITIGQASQMFNQLTPGSISTISAPWSGNGGDVQVELLDATGNVLLSGKGGNPISNAITSYNFSWVNPLQSPGTTTAGNTWFSPLPQTMPLSFWRRVEDRSRVTRPNLVQSIRLLPSLHYQPCTSVP